LNGAVHDTGDQTTLRNQGLRTGAGFGLGSTAEYASASDAVFGSYNRAAGGLEIIGNKTANISMANQ